MNIIRTQDFPPVRLASEELYKYLLITQCNALGSILPVMFHKKS